MMPILCDIDHNNPDIVDQDERLARFRERATKLKRGVYLLRTEQDAESDRTLALRELACVFSELEAVFGTYDQMFYITSMSGPLRGLKIIA